MTTPSLAALAVGAPSSDGQVTLRPEDRALVAQSAGALQMLWGQLGEMRARHIAEELKVLADITQVKGTYEQLVGVLTRQYLGSEAGNWTFDPVQGTWTKQTETP